jgi:4-amino-4-deoxy-L-arabinose transferase-like glycosyltransferase
VKLNLRTKQVLKSDKRSFVALLSENYPLLGILIGTVLVSASIGPLLNIDTQLEFDAASGVIKWGLPYITYKNMINQPPLGFETGALFLKVFGLSYNTGVALITLIGLGCTVLVYQLGKTLYGKPTAILAAALFALTPWQFALSRSFLIDAQCLFFSLLCLLVGIYAIRKDSFVLFMLSGTLFATALLTKFFAVFILIPLTFFYFYRRQSKLKRVLVVVAYFLPTLLFLVVWYQILTGRGLISIIVIEDFNNFNPVGTVPSFFFIINYLLDGLGALFLIATALSLVVSFAGRRLFAKLLPFDLMCLASILVVGGINTFLAVGLNLKSPYINPIKYDYQFLPFFSLLAASLVGKCFLLFNSAKSKEKLSKLLFFIASVGLVLLAVSMFVNMNFLNQHSTADHWLFKVERNQYIGYSFINSMPLDESSPLMRIQYLGFAFVLSGLVWASRHKLAGFLYGSFKRMLLWFEAKNAFGTARREEYRNSHERLKFNLHELYHHLVKMKGLELRQQIEEKQANGYARELVKKV